eukprot:gnl/Spiro4/2318_TR1117_c0_g1_i1.p1 gnl/Spiro4/2318_TR1117_c0_g1~~gnl/Spiro4/2318_TR1117_c0_g1_i1.p1  ORF type:complete len:211 (+),score=30.96 gnl/Spiro4/2318_TR1117_c0_g1_i1:71-703(+)
MSQGPAGPDLHRESLKEPGAKTGHGPVDYTNPHQAGQFRGPSHTTSHYAWLNEPMQVKWYDNSYRKIIGRGPNPTLILGTVFAMTLWGASHLSRARRRLALRANERVQARIPILAFVQAEDDLRNSYLAAKDYVAEYVVMRDVKGWTPGKRLYNSDTYVRPRAFNHASIMINNGPLGHMSNRPPTRIFLSGLLQRPMGERPRVPAGDTPY